MNLKLKRTPGIYVVGFMGAGKSTVGRHLAHRLGWNFFDTDAEIEAAEKTAISAIFDTRGEPEFRRIETAIIRQHVGWIERGRAAVLALGGGAFSQPDNRALLENNGITSGWIARSKPCSTVWAAPSTAPWRAIPRPSPPCTPPAATITPWPTCTFPSPATIPKSPSPPSWPTPSSNDRRPLFSAVNGGLAHDH